MLTAALFIIDKTWKQPRSCSIVERVDKWYIPTIIIQR